VSVGVAEAEAYDAYKLELSQTSLILLTDASRWHHETGITGDVLELLAPKHAAHIELALRRCVVEGSTQYPALCLDLLVHPIELELLPEYIESVTAVLVALPPTLELQTQTQPNESRSSSRMQTPVKKKCAGNVRHLSANLVLQRLTIEVAAPDTPLMKVDVTQVIVNLTHNEYDSQTEATVSALSVVDLYTDSTVDQMKQIAQSGQDGHSVSTCACSLLGVDLVPPR